jgi:hypothetical protein
MTENFAERFIDRLRQKQEIEFDLAQREQFIRATVNMLPEYQKPPWEALLAADIRFCAKPRGVPCNQIVNAACETRRKLECQPE